MQVLTTLILNIISFLTSYVLNTDLAPFWGPFKYKRLAWIFGTLLISAVCVGMVYMGAPLGAEIPGPFLWDGVNFIIILAATTYYTSQTTHTFTRHAHS